jgi:hypothetical protein
MTNCDIVTNSLYRDRFKMSTNANTDGLVNCLRQPGQILHSPNIYVSNYHPLIKLLHREQSCIRDKVYGAVGRRAVVMVFAWSSANFHTGSNSRRLSGLSHLDNFIVTANLSPLIGTMQKHMPTLTQTATNQTAGPLGASGGAVDMSELLKYYYRT